MTDSGSSRLSTGQQAMRDEAAAILQAAERLDANFEAAVDLILKTKSKLVICGIGKSGHIGCKSSGSIA